jgi:hypothetical protein
LCDGLSVAISELNLGQRKAGVVEVTREDELLPVALTLAYQPPAAAGHWAESGLFQPNQMNMHFIGGAYFCIFNIYPSY